MSLRIYILIVCEDPRVGYWCLETFGTGYDDDVDNQLYKCREKESHISSAIKKL